MLQMQMLAIDYAVGNFPSALSPTAQSYPYHMVDLHCKCITEKNVNFQDFHFNIVESDEPLCWIFPIQIQSIEFVTQNEVESTPNETLATLCISCH